VTLSPGAIKNTFNAHFGHFGKYLIESNEIMIGVTENIE
jgi:hypothetical protein